MAEAPPSAREVSLAKVFYGEFGINPSPDQITAFAAWLRSESGNGNSYHNPLNLGGGGPYTTGTASNGFNVYASDVDGVKAAAYRLIKAPGTCSGCGYEQVVKTIETGDTAGFVDAVTRSKWDKTHYGQQVIHGFLQSHLIARFYAMGGVGIGQGTPADLPASPGSANVAAWGNLVTFAQGHVLTQSDIDTIMSKLDAGGFFNSGDPIADNIARSDAQKVLQGYIGQTWTPDLLGKMQAAFSAEAAKQPTNPADVLQAIFGPAAGAIAQIAGAITNPQDWLSLFAFMGGLVAVGVGSYMLWQSTGGGAPAGG